MTDIAQGAHAKLILNPGDVFRISTAGSATVQAAYGAPAGTVTVTANSQDFGPYQALAKLIVTATSGKASYGQLGVTDFAASAFTAQDVAKAKLGGKVDDLIPLLSAYYVFGQRNYAPSGLVTNTSTQYQCTRIRAGRATSQHHSFVFSLPGWQTANGASSDTAAPTAIIIDGVSMGYGLTDNPAQATWIAGTIGGSATATLDPAVTPEGLLTDDFLANAPLPAGSAAPYYTWFAVAFHTAAAGASLPSVCTFGSGSSEGNIGSTTNNVASYLTSGANINIPYRNTSWGPNLVACKGHTAPVAGVMGDSIARGFADSVWGQTKGTAGFIAKGLLAAGMHNASIAVGGTSPEAFVASGRNAALHRLNNLKKLTTLNGGVAPFTFLISEHLTNAMDNAGWTTSTGLFSKMAAYAKFLRTEFPGLRIAQTQVPLRHISSTDLNTTLAGQTVDPRFITTGRAKAFNDQLILSPQSLGFDLGIQIIPAMEDPSNPGKTRVSSYVGSLTAPYTAGDTTFQVDNLPPDRATLVLNGAEAQAMYNPITGSGPYTISIGAALTNSYPTGTPVRETYAKDTDGLHPETNMHALMAPAVEALARQLITATAFV